ncbi:hypothetical protein [Paractinoplanes rishiriensis]|uniref:DUF4232 domain-containing protein n=1 Tax=Paractinoplanes rishiriensis TaxID=1050105 RepID=A0A919K1B4_9ACTN|nr:hypothetical protein [Actinoplanes rishiriensis]GIE98820.1 hypothetical protein Ari01nite_62850 [Actinoplanes rishiriensis]
MTADQRLRAELTDDRYALPGWPDPVGRISTGVRRRKQRRRVNAAAAGLAVLVLAGLGIPSLRGGATPDTTAGSAVPWADVPAPEPSLARRSVRPDARDCAAADLGKAWSESNGPGHTVVLLPTRIDSRCTLRGSAGIVATDIRTGERGPVSTTQSWVDGASTGAAGYDGVSQVPATIDPGEPARLDVVTTADCAGPPADTHRYRDVAVVVQGREIPVPAVLLSTACPVQVGIWRVLPPLLNLPWVTATIVAPQQVRRGETLRYEVTLTGKLANLKPCPTYRQRLGTTGETLRLNCAAFPEKPGKTVRLAMELDVPADAAPGDTRLTWMLVAGDGHVVIADLSTGGVAVEITG